MAKCITCGDLTDYYNAPCVDCYEVESRLQKYLKSSKGLDFVRSKLPRLDDWVDGTPDAWDYEAVLTEQGVKLEQSLESPFDWTLCWRHGFMHVPCYDEVNAKKAAALFVSLWLRGVSASFADKLMVGYMMFLEYQENGQA
jgi:hypothetical protein